MPYLGLDSLTGMMTGSRRVTARIVMATKMETETAKHYVYQRMAYPLGLTTL